MKRKTVELTDAQDDFIKRKVEELRRHVPPGSERSVSDSSVIQGLIDFWMAFEARKTLPNKSHKGNEVPRDLG